MLKRSDVISDIFFVITGGVDVVKGISVLFLLSTVFPTQFGVLSVNMDIMSALIPFGSPWVVAFLQLSKISKRRAYNVCVSALMIIGGMIAAIYLVISLNLIAHGGDNTEKIIFLALRTFSVFILVFVILNQSYLMLLGFGQSVFWLQIGVWLANFGLYLTIWLSVSEFSYVIAGLGMVMIDSLLLIVGLYILKKTGNMAYTFTKPSLKFSFKIRRIVVPELFTVASISLSGLLLSAAAFKISPGHFSDFRIPFAFQVACWMICARATVLIMRRYSVDNPALLYDAFLYAFKTTWFVPAGLALIAVALFGQMSGDQFIHSLAAITYYPAMIVVIALNGVVRLKAANDIISSANKWLLVLFFFPLSAGIYYGHVEAINIIHFVGASYALRALTMFYLYNKRFSSDDNRCAI
ncbi:MULTISPECIES: hypothetical protein [Pseudomonas syringae group]|uniref:Uncharacterized protein n=2 Tax=Pseudomonas syringae group TaxID=136849 RepID=A0A3M2X111_PSEA0|nr:MULTISPECIES: hypothetical protein [Pseudomonas syringae group]EGH14136.1 hypothetical protein PSYMP_26788 [Pseudomonas amygdali pv. morsprunorum str. M302280]KWS71686.1 hypothetical protein AL055_13090 [Pseudomonas amygdali pv. morsprunorum]PHN35709.1 hypothetical protein AO261_11915 [Pseudomonas avellanae]POC82463.1 hypothetical protein BKM26_26730 [Pseudomonas avellanae]POD00002.1 hypothetical protein BKM20_26815 [Pseudomonas avellanae]